MNESKILGAQTPHFRKTVYAGYAQWHAMKVRVRGAAHVFQTGQREHFPTAANSLELSGKAISVWRFRTGSPKPSIAEYSSILSPDERQRAEQFRLDEVRRSFVLTRFALRSLLGRYLHADPAKIQFGYGENGKPALSPESSVRFNVAHSGGMAVMAFALDCEIGVDVERIRSFAGIADVAARFFHPDEAARVDSLALDEREQAFFDAWVRKEAYLKATGEGLGAGLQDFQIKSAAPGADLHLERQGQPDDSWTFHDLQLAPGYAAALAYRDQARDPEISQLLTFAELEGLLAVQSSR